MDCYSQDKRSAVMRRVRSSNTTPELRIRCLLHSHGYRYRLHAKDLPGSPDLVFPARRKIIFIHGCFWHGHACRRGDRTPKTNRTYWLAKIEQNQRRDQRVQRHLRRLGWSVAVVWECQTRDIDRLLARLVRFLEAEP